MRVSPTLPVLVSLAVAATACGGPPAGRSAVPVGRGAAAVVVTDDWAVAEVASEVGDGALTVVRPPPTPLPAGALALTSPRSTATFVAAAATTAHHLAFGGDALVPDDLAAFGGQVAAALGSVAPTGVPRWRDGLAALRSQLHSTTGDLETSLQSCPRRTLVTDGPQLNGFAAIGDIKTEVVTTTTAGPVAAAAVRAAGGTVFAVEGADDTALRAAAAAAGAKVVAVGTLVAAPPGAPPSLGYAGGIEDVLAMVTRGLGCPLEQ